MLVLATELAEIAVIMCRISTFSASLQCACIYTESTVCVHHTGMYKGNYTRQQQQLDQ